MYFIFFMFDSIQIIFLGLWHLRPFSGSIKYQYLKDIHAVLKIGIWQEEKTLIVIFIESE